MQEITFSEKPSPHIIIDEFLPPKLARECLQEAIRLEPFYEDARIESDYEAIKHMENCVTCKKQFEDNRSGIRENDVVYMDNAFKNKRGQSSILRSLEKTIISPWFLNLINKKGFWHILNYTTSTETILSRYGKCDFYGWHTDTLPHNPTGRLVTLCYYLNEEPEEFEGGELIIAGENIHDSIKIKPKHNRAIIFESHSTTHAVNTVKLLSDEFSKGRFSINFWIGMSLEHKYR